MSYSLRFPAISHVGWNTVEQVNNEMKNLQVEKVLVISDDVLLEIDSVKKVIARMKEEYLVCIYADVEPEPTLECAQRLVDFMKSDKFDCVIGIGGGSILDLAKLAAVLSQHEGQVSEYLNLTGTKQITKKGLPKILIPTTSGTGSEVTNISVLALPGTKDVVVHDYMIADVAIVDPQLTLTVPAKITAATGADALTHAVEAFLSVQSNSVTDGLAEKAISLISSSLKTAVDYGKDEAARINLSEGSFIAGLAFFHAGVAGVHALAYPLGSKFHIPHGESNAVLLPYVISYIAESCPLKMKKIASFLDKGYSDDKNYDQNEYLQLFKKLIEEIALPTSLSSYGITEDDLEELTLDALKQSRLLARSPLALEKEDIYAIYKNAFDGIEAYAIESRQNLV